MVKNIQKAPINSENSHNFIPNLCKAEPMVIFYIAAVILAGLMEIVQNSLIHFDLGSFLIHLLLISLIIFSSITLMCSLRHWVNKHSLIFASLFCFIVLMGSSLFFCSAFAWSGVVGFPEESTWQTLFRLQLISFLITGILFRFLYLQMQLSLHKKSKLISQVEALQARIRPHFLFNSLNSISSLILIDPDKAEEAIDDLADLFRASLTKDYNSTIGDEIEVCKHYFRIEKLRLADRLTVQWDVDEQLLSCTMPHLLMQPLAENAIYHGIQVLPKGGIITITIQQTAKGEIRVVIENPLLDTRNITRKSATAPTSKSNHMALANIRSRLVALYRSRANMTIEQTQTAYKVTIVYPKTLGNQD